MDLIIFLLLGHYIGDFGLQTDRMAADKKNSKSRLTLHVFTYTITICMSFMLYWALEGMDNPVSGALLAMLTVILFATHWLQDYIKGRLGNSKQLYYIDQSLHMVLLVVFRYIIIR
jgi:hypothetical protein